MAVLIDDSDVEFQKLKQAEQAFFHIGELLKVGTFPGAHAEIVVQAKQAVQALVKETEFKTQAWIQSKKEEGKKAHEQPKAENQSAA